MVECKHLIMEQTFLCILEHLPLAETLANYYGNGGYGSAGYGSPGGYNALTMLGLGLMLLAGLVGGIVQNRMMAAMKQFSATPAPYNGADVARAMLRDNGISGVQVTHTPGQLTDHYNPANRTVNLSDMVHSTYSVAAMAVAAHECGHAVQHAVQYAPLKMRSALVPVINISSTWSTWVILIGVLMLNSFPAIYWVGIAMIAASALFSLVTLPVEYNASARALQWLQMSRTLDEQTLPMARTSLRWAARTYLVSALSAVAVLLYYLGFARRDD